jgi:hypothetical protein
VTGENNVSKEIMNCLIATNSSYFGLKSQFKSQLLSKNTKILIYKTLVRPILTYAAETWTMTKNDERRQSLFERKVLPRICGPICKEGQWQNNEPNTVNVIKSSRLRWTMCKWMKMNCLKRYCGHTLEVNEDMANQNKHGLMG